MVEKKRKIKSVSLKFYTDKQQDKQLLEFLNKQSSKTKAIKILLSFAKQYFGNVNLEDKLVQIGERHLAQKYRGTEKDLPSSNESNYKSSEGNVSEEGNIKSNSVHKKRKMNFFEDQDFGNL